MFSTAPVTGPQRKFSGRITILSIFSDRGAHEDALNAEDALSVQDALNAEDALLHEDAPFLYNSFQPSQFN